MKKKIAVIGANGYIGRHLVYFLFKKNYKIFAFDIHENIHKTLPKNIFYKKIDISEKNQCSQIEYNVDFLFVFSGKTGTYNGFSEYEDFLRINELGLLNILNEVKLKVHKPHIIYPSTRLVYKGSKNPLEEEASKEVKTVYAVNKLAAELYIKSYSNSFKIPYTIFRICVPYGNILDNNFSYGTIGFFYKKASNRENIILFGDGSLKRTFTNIEYLCNQILEVLDKDEAKNQVFNIDGEPFSLIEVAKKIAKRFAVNIEFAEWPKNHLLIETGSTVFNSNKILKLIKQKTQTNLQDWINDIAL